MSEGQDAVRTLTALGLEARCRFTTAGHEISVRVLETESIVSLLPIDRSEHGKFIAWMARKAKEVEADPRKLPPRRESEDEKANC